MLVEAAILECFWVDAFSLLMRLTTQEQHYSKAPYLVYELISKHQCCRYAVSELQRDVERLLAALPESEREANRTQFAIFVGE